MSKFLGIDKAARFFEMIRANGGWKASYLKLFRYKPNSCPNVYYITLTNKPQLSYSFGIFMHDWNCLLLDTMTLNWELWLAKTSTVTNTLKAPITFMDVIVGLNMLHT